MNILCISDQFKSGGLETHIDNYYEALKKKNKIVFAFAKFDNTKYLKKAKIYTDNLNFSANATINDFVNDVNKLVEIIKEENIDLIHVHPFYSLFPALFAANLTGTKLVFTVHGRSSITYPSYSNDTLLFQFAIDECISKIFCVSKSYCYWLDNHEKDNIAYFPNLINEKNYSKHIVAPNKTWALISRLDEDKEQEIIKFLSILPELDIKHLDIYGSGTASTKLMEYIKKLKLESIITFKGYVSDLNNNLKNYTGLIGQGRAALEGLTMNYPTILMGYNKIIGLIDAKLYEASSKLNFVPSFFEEVKLKDLIKSIKEINHGHYEKYQLRDRAINDFSIKKYDEYLKNISSIENVTIPNLNKCFKEISNLLNKEYLFYSNGDVFYILYKYLTTYTTNPKIKNIFNLYNSIYQTQNELYDLRHKYNNILKRLDQIEQDMK